jgi:hypothetical protein
MGNADELFFGFASGLLPYGERGSSFDTAENGPFLLVALAAIAKPRRLPGKP